MTCNHAPVANMQGQIVSPARVYGRGLRGALVCGRCGQVIEKIVKKKPTKKG